MNIRTCATPVALLLAAVALTSCPARAANTLESVVSASPTVLGVQGDASSSMNRYSLSADGRYAVFSSASDNLVPGDDNGRSDVFLADLETGALTLLSRAPDGGSADGASTDAAISGDGQYIAFQSAAGNLVPGDVAGANQIFIVNRSSGAVSKLSSAALGLPSSLCSPALSYDGSVLVGWATSGDCTHPYTISVFRYSRQTGTALVVPGVVTTVTGVSSDGNVVLYWDGQTKLYDVSTGTPSTASLDTAGVVVNSDGERPSMSADGRYVVFSAMSASVVPNDTNQKSDVFLRDRQNGTTTRVSVAADGSEAKGASNYPTLSADGTHVAFLSTATNLVPGAGGNRIDRFVKNLQTGAVALATPSLQAPPPLSVESGQPAALSADGGTLLFSWSAGDLVPGDSNARRDVFRWSAAAPQPRRLSVRVGTALQAGGNGNSDTPAFSPDGRYIAYRTVADNLDPGAVAEQHIVLYDRQSATSSVIANPEQPADYPGNFSDDSRLFVYRSGPVPPEGTIIFDPPPPCSSLQGTVRLRNLQTGVDSPMVVASSGQPSAGAAQTPVLSADGGTVAFVALATDLLPQPTSGCKLQAFARSLSSGSNELISARPDGGEGNSDTGNLVLSGDGRYAAFSSFSTDLVAGDSNGKSDVFLRDRQTHITTRISVAPGGAQLNGSSYVTAMTPDGRYVAFISDAAELRNDSAYTSGAYDAYVVDLHDGVVRRATHLYGYADTDSAYLQDGRMSLSRDGRTVVFSSPRIVLPGSVAGTELYAVDVDSGAVVIVSTDARGQSGDGVSSTPLLSADGKWIVFQSTAGNWHLDGGRNGAFSDVFIRSFPSPDTLFTDDFE